MKNLSMILGFLLLIGVLIWVAIRVFQAPGSPTIVSVDIKGIIQEQAQQLASKPGEKQTESIKKLVEQLQLHIEALAKKQNLIIVQKGSAFGVLEDKTEELRTLIRQESDS